MRCRERKEWERTNESSRSWMETVCSAPARRSRDFCRSSTWSLSSCFVVVGEEKRGETEFSSVRKPAPTCRRFALQLQLGDLLHRSRSNRNTYLYIPFNGTQFPPGVTSQQIMPGAVVCLGQLWELM